jgi:hypothetical protein
MALAQDQPGRVETLRTGVRIYVVVGVLFLALFVGVATGPWKWLSGAIGAVCLLRALYYWLTARWSQPLTRGKS